MEDIVIEGTWNPPEETYKVGDIVEVSINGEKADCKIVGKHFDEGDDGIVLKLYFEMVDSKR